MIPAAPSFTIEPYPGREGRTGEKVQVTMPNAGNPLRRPPKIEGYECFFVSYFGTEGVTKFSYKRVAYPESLDAGIEDNQDEIDAAIAAEEVRYMTDTNDPRP